MRFDKTYTLPPMHKTSIGFDSMFRELERQFMNSSSPTKTGYPPYNIIQHDEYNYEIMMAVSGFSMDQLSVVQEKNVLCIEGNHADSEESDDFDDNEERSFTYLHKGIAERSFKREFTLADHVEVKQATLLNGMLHVKLVRTLPEELQPKRVVIQQLP